MREDATADIAETLHIGRIGVLDSDYAPLVIDWRAPAAAPFYRSTPKDPGRVVRRRVIRSKGRQVLGVEDDLMRPELTASLGGEKLPVIGDGALMAALGQARSHTMRDIVSSIQAEQDLVIRAPAASVTEVTGGPGTGKTAVALHRAAYLLYQDRRRYAGGILIVSPTPLLVAYTEGVLPSLGEEGQVAIRAIGSLSDDAAGLDGATAYDEPPVARIKGSSRMSPVLRKAARGALERGRPAAPRQEAGELSFGEEPEDAPAAAVATPDRLRVVAFGARIELEADELPRIRDNVLGGTAPVNLLRPRARKLLLDALWNKSSGRGRHTDPELAAELRSSFDEDVATQTPFLAFLDAWWPELTPGAGCWRPWPTSAASPAGPGASSTRARRPQAVSPSAALRGGRGPASVHDVALLDELQAPPRPPGPAPRASARPTRWTSSPAWRS
ncbi:UvrD-helicase domain-containing protein [Streptomyces californicus]